MRLIAAILISLAGTAFAQNPEYAQEIKELGNQIGARAQLEQDLIKQIPDNTTTNQLAQIENILNWTNLWLDDHDETELNEDLLHRYLLDAIKKTFEGCNDDYDAIKILETLSDEERSGIFHCFPDNPPPTPRESGEEYKIFSPSELDSLQQN